MRIVDEILAPARGTELVCQTHIQRIETLHRIIERLDRHNSKNIQETIDKLEREEQQLNAGIDRLVERRETALKYINKLSGSEYAVIYRYYIMGQDWETISEETHFSPRAVFVRRKKALTKLEDIYCKEVQNG